MQPYRDNPFDDSNSSGLYDPYNPAPTRQYTSSPLNPASVQKTLPPAPAHPAFDPVPAESTDDLITPTAAIYGGARPRNLQETATVAGSTPIYSAPYPANPTAETLWMTDMNREGGSEPKYHYTAPPPNKKKWVILGLVVVFAGLAVIGVVVGVVMTSVKRKGSSSSATSSGSGSGSGSSVTQTDAHDPSKFTKDANLHQSFYGIAYTPTGSIVPDCGNSLSDVIHDVQIMSQLTKRVRLYGADCNVSALVLEAIRQTKVDMQVFLGNYPLATDNGAAYKRQRDVIKKAIETYGTSNIAGLTVGNEFMLNYLNANSATDPNSSVGDQGAALLIADIQDTRSMLSSLGVSIPVGTSDAGAYFNSKVLAAVDYGLANVHPWFANVSAEQSAAWTSDFFQQTDVSLANTLSNKPKMYIAETGWPTKSSDKGNANNGASTASEANLQIFLDTFICQANTNGTGYFFFEFCDEPWKDKIFGGVEGWWGLLNSDRSLKNVKVPNCSSP